MQGYAAMFRVLVGGELKYACQYVEADNIEAAEALARRVVVEEPGLQILRQEWIKPYDRKRLRPT
jgi:hypothetical protein